MKLNHKTGKGVIVTVAGLAINLALGVLYAWSVFKESIIQSVKRGGESDFKWDLASLNDPYALCVLMFAFSMTFAGRIQDKKGPSFTAKIGGLLIGSGFILASLTTNYYAWIAGFGILGGMGMGFGYSATTPAALKWFSSAKTGLIAGIVVSGFGIAPLYIAPLASYFVGNYGIQNTMLIFGISFLIIVCGLAFLLKNPPADYIVAEPELKVQKKSKRAEQTKFDYSASYMLKTTKFYVL